MGLDLSIIIISFNTKKFLEGCLNSIYETVRHLSYEIIVVDNASSDGSPEMIETKFKNIKLIKNNFNYGFAKANNQAIKIAQGEYVLLLNSDTLLKKNSIENLVSFMQVHPKAAAAGPKVLNADGSIQSTGGHFPSVLNALVMLFRIPAFFPESTLRTLVPRYAIDINIPSSVDTVNGCCFLMKKAAINDIGLLSEDFFMYGEEDEWCYRAKALLYEIWYVAESEIIHLNESSVLPNRSDVRIRSTATYYKKTVGRIKGILVSAINISLYATRYLSIYVNSLFNIHNKHIAEHTKSSLIINFKLLKSLFK